MRNPPERQTWSEGTKKPRRAARLTTTDDKHASSQPRKDGAATSAENGKSCVDHAGDMRQQPWRVNAPALKREGRTADAMRPGKQCR